MAETEDGKWLFAVSLDRSRRSGFGNSVALVKAGGLMKPKLPLTRYTCDEIVLARMGAGWKMLL